MITAPDNTRQSTDVDADGRIHFPNGLLGFPDTREYHLAEGPAEGLFWLLAGDGRGPCFLLSDPFVFFEGYTLDLTPAQADQIGADEMSQVAVLTITVPGEGDAPWTANLQGPVVVNVEKRLGAQLVLSGPAPDLRKPFRPDVPKSEQRRVG